MLTWDQLCGEVSIDNTGFREHFVDLLSMVITDYIFLQQQQQTEKSFKRTASQAYRKVDVKTENSVICSLIISAIIDCIIIIRAAFQVIFC